jgi:hypothetical protein
MLRDAALRARTEEDVAVRLVAAGLADLPLSKTWAHKGA